MLNTTFICILQQKQAKYGKELETGENCMSNGSRSKKLDCEELLDQSAPFGPYLKTQNSDCTD